MPQTLYLIDGFAQIFRAYFAIRTGLRSPVTSEPTHAVFGVTGMLMKLLGTLNPDYIAVAMDAPGKTFRDELYAEYKGTRNETPDDLIVQIPRVKEMIGLFGIPMIGVPGLEADDVIATIVERILNSPEYADVHVRIVSKDKDLEQLLCDRVSLYDVHTDSLLDVAGLFEAKGIHPHQVIDYLSLVGDTADNVPGVAGIGPKTAAQLIQEHGSLDGIYEAIEQVKGKKRENLEGARGHLPLTRTLVTLKRDGDFEFSLADAAVRPASVPPLVAIFKELGFTRFQEEIVKLYGASSPGLVDALVPESIESLVETTAGEPAAGVVGAAPVLDLTQGFGQQGQYHAVTSLAALNDLVCTLEKQTVISVDTETTGLERDSKLCGLSIAWETGSGVYVPVLSPEPGLHLTEEEVIAALGPVLSNPEIGKCGHNVKFDAGVLLRSGVTLRGIVFDSFLASTLINPARQAHKLDNLAESVLGYAMVPITDLIGPAGEQASMDTVPLDKITSYAAEDADIALRLYQVLQPKLAEMGMSDLMLKAEAPLTGVIATMEGNGIICDPQELDAQRSVLAERVTELRAQIFEVAGGEFGLDSPSQLAVVLFDRLGLASGKKTKTGRSTDIQELERLAALEDRNEPKTSVPRLVIEYRQLTKLIGTYLGNLKDSINPQTGRIHSTFHQLYAATGRLASQNPNLQNIPVRTDVGRQIRKAFKAAPGYKLICADYSQVELRILAHLSQDEALLQAFAEDQDIHAAVAAQVFEVSLQEVTREQRSHAKTINFGIIYGVTPFGLARRIEGLGVGAATRLIQGYKARFAGIDRFLQQCVHQALDTGYVSTIMGRRRYIPEIQSTNSHMKSLGERMAINSVVQGSAADLIKLAMVNVEARIEREQLPMRLLLQIHDELVLECPEEVVEEHAVIVCDEMAGAMSLRVPLLCAAGIGRDWFEAK